MGGEDIQISAAEAAGLLRWWLDSGVDCLVQEQPRNWLEGEAPPPPAASPAASPAAPLPAAAHVEQQDFETLDLFRDWLGTADAMPLARAGARRVLPQGVEGAPVMLLADAPNEEDSSADRPMAGEAWQLAERMLAAIGIDAQHAYCANISCFHSPGARMSPDELEACAAIARRHVALAKPKRLLLLGEGPSRALLGKSVAAARGHVHKVEGVHTIATFHPRFLLNRPSNKSLAWKDLLLLMEDTG